MSNLDDRRRAPRWEVEDDLYFDLSKLLKVVSWTCVVLFAVLWWSSVTWLILWFWD